MATQSPFEILAPELKVMIMKLVGLRSVPALAMTNKSFYNTFKEHEGVIAYAAAVKYIGHLFPRAVALYAAGRAPWRGVQPAPTDEELLANIQEFGRKYLNFSTGSIPIKPKEFTFTQAMEMADHHDNIQEYATEFTTKEIGRRFSSMLMDMPIRGYLLSRGPRSTGEDRSRKIAFRNSVISILTDLGNVDIPLYALQIRNELIFGSGDFGSQLGDYIMSHYFPASEIGLVQMVSLVIHTLVKSGNRHLSKASFFITSYTVLY